MKQYFFKAYIGTKTLSVIFIEQLEKQVLEFTREMDVSGEMKLLADD